ncbi:MAG: hypothetical protein IKV31_07995 [Paludibacteraceae bacterium]|nr:hypothetical protein [Paludibacteraceae bacterium]
MILLFAFRKQLVDFTLHRYRSLLESLLQQGYQFLTFEQYLQAKNDLPAEGDLQAKRSSNEVIFKQSDLQAKRSSNEVIFKQSDLPTKYILLRHDVDLKAANSLATAQIEHELGIQASYYFRVVPQSNQPDIIRAIADLGHEIGYHYEDMAIMHGDVDKAYAHFVEQLTYFRQFYPVRTICMHGAPTSQWDGKDLWKHYNYHDLGIIGEPYFDIDFSQMFYLTDTGRCWDGYKVSVRDKIPVYQDQWNAQGLVYHTTNDIIHAAEQGSLPPCIMITTHPQRWTDSPLAWLKELIVQNAKNIIKRLFFVK